VRAIFIQYPLISNAWALRVLSRSLFVSVMSLVCVSCLRADWKDDVGYTRLLQTFTSGVPTAVANGVSQAEAGDANGNSYQPDFSNSEFTGKVLTVKSAGSGISGHATTVGSYFYGSTTSLMPATTGVDIYNATNWAGTDFLNYNTPNVPKTETRRVQNHSWISTFDTSVSSYAQINNTVSNINQRLDFASDRDGFLAVAGASNGASTVLPDLMCQAYHGLAVGLVNGNHSAGLTAYDGTGRMKPDLVAYEGATSFATPQVSSAAGLISEKLSLSTYSPALANADYPRLTKALLLAGATKDALSSWSRADNTKPYDAVYGAGALNVLLAYRILAAGPQTASSSATVAATGWAIAAVSKTTRAANRTYFFDIPAGTANARFSCALTWHRAITSSNLTTFGATTILANLDLRLYPVAAGTFTIGTQIDASLSTVDNVEHLYQAALAPGRYALQVSYSSSIFTSSSLTTYALAWRSSPTVTVAATSAIAREQDGTAGVFTLTRTGATTSPLLVPLIWGGTAVPGTHYLTPPTTVLIPAGSSTATVTVSPIADDVAQGNRTLTLSVATDFSLSAGNTPTDTVTLQDKPYDAWRFAHFTAAELADATLSGPNADPDGDGLPNLLEYALGADPKTADASNHAAQVGFSADHLTLAYTRPSTVTDLNYALEWTTDLQTWSTGNTVIEQVNSTTNPDGTITVTSRAVALLSSSPRQFLRLRITRP
jgi:hypothetical protein